MDKVDIYWSLLIYSQYLLIDFELFDIIWIWINQICHYYLIRFQEFGPKMLIKRRFKSDFKQNSGLSQINSQSLLSFMFATQTYCFMFGTRQGALIFHLTLHNTRITFFPNIFFSVDEEFHFHLNSPSFTGPHISLMFVFQTYLLD